MSGSEPETRLDFITQELHQTVLTPHHCSLRRYVAYDGTKESNSAAASADISTPGAPSTTREPSSVRNSTKKVDERPPQTVGRVAGSGSKSTLNGDVSHDSGVGQEAMADLHLSGSDPRLFPGIFMRDHRSGSLRNLNQADEWVVDSNEAPGDDDEDEL